MSEEMKEKNAKWNILINSLHENLVQAKKQKLELENEIYRLRIKHVQSKVGQQLRTNKTKECQKTLLLNHQEDLNISINKR